MRLDRTVAVLYAHQHVGRKSLEPFDRQRLARQVRCAFDLRSIQPCTGNHFAGGFVARPTAIRKNRHEPLRHADRDRLLPQDLISTRVALDQLEKAGLQLVTD